MAKAKRVSIALLAPGFALALLLPVLGVIVMLTGGVMLAIALESELVAAEGGPGAPSTYTTRTASRKRVA